MGVDVEHGDPSFAWLCQQTVGGGAHGAGDHRGTWEARRGEAVGGATGGRYQRSLLFKEVLSRSRKRWKKGEIVAESRMCQAEWERSSERAPVSRLAGGTRREAQCQEQRAVDWAQLGPWLVGGEVGRWELGSPVVGLMVAVWDASSVRMGAECYVLPLTSCEVWAGHSFSVPEISRLEMGIL